MNIELNLKNDKFHFEVTNQQGNTMQMDASPAIGGENKGFRPMETLLAGLGGCSAIDVLSILKKQRQEVEDVNIRISATRREKEMPAIFETINVHFIVSGRVDEEKLKKAIKLTTEKFCSVYHIMKETAKIFYTYEIQITEKAKTEKVTRFETAAIRTQIPRTQQKEHSAPIYMTSSFVFDDAEEGRAIFANEQEGNIYTRFTNPNTDEFVNKMCLLEGTEAGIATSSGMSAIFASILPYLKVGDHIVASRSLFGNTLRIICEQLPKWGISYTLVPIDDLQAWEKAVLPNTKMLLVESPSNPALDFADLEALGRLARAHGILFNVDNCFATPFLQQPLKYGADLIVHSATKWIDGQGRVLGGVILGKKDIIETAYNFTRSTGPAMSPFNAWVLSKSLETLAVRMERHCENARMLALFLEQHPEINSVKYPGLSTHPQYELAKSQMRLGGGMLTCIVKGGVERGQRFLDNLNMMSLTANLGDTRSIATHPASTTHSKLSVEQREAAGIYPGLLRFSLGLEHIDDIIEDVVQALEKSKI
jgi:O-succinylhomoserine sulfhydrylase